MQKILRYAPFVLLAALIAFYVYNKYRVPPSIDFSKIHLKDLQGQELKFEQFRGKKLIVSFGASWCPNCIEELNMLKKIRETELAGIEVVVISDEPLERVQYFKSKREYPFTFLKMEEPFSAVGISSIPTSYIYNSSLELKHQEVGAPDWDDPSFVEHMKKLMGS